MADGPYLLEREVEYWISRDIGSFLLDQGFDLMVLPIGQLMEHRIPADFIFVDITNSKIFGLQYKALYHNSYDYWNLDGYQHNTLASIDWIYYGLSDMKTRRQQRNAIHYLRVLGPRFGYKRQITKLDLRAQGMPRYRRWASFYEGLIACQYGRVISNPAELMDLLPQGDEAVSNLLRMLHDIFITNFDRMRALRYTSALSS